MSAAIITVAGISSRFNEGVPEEDKELKAIYSERSAEDTLLYHLIQKCVYADKIIIVGGYKFDRLRLYCERLEKHLQEKIAIVHNEQYNNLASGYSLYLGLLKAFEFDVEEVLFE